MQLIIENFPLLLTGLWHTLQLAIVTLLGSTVISVAFGLMGVARSGVLRATSMAYVEFFRDIPLIVNVLFVYFGAPLIGISLDPFGAATISFSLWGGANGAEIVRSGFNSVPLHQERSAVALGLKPWEVMWYVLAPQALLPIIPPFTGLFSLLIQATSLASMVGAMEFFRTSQIIVERTTMMTGYSPAFLVYGFVLLVYFVICASLSALTKRLETSLSERQSRRGGRKAAIPQAANESI
ncbi:amino acid ABC transporter permease [Chelativorans sp. YIM 93263]|uniref:amino acid ABC transporter permease n=1 Tax=Chelativorans sp. YIM 93263 TaxID=2906648 RepID=UPI002379E55B|nr:amino acid ABC transporter permease [Chelativorans sp. YIM 93263]